MNLEQARFNMVEQQIRTWEVLDPAVLDLLYAVPREDFVPAAYRKLAFADMEIPIGEGESMMAPRIEARILQALSLRKTDRVLEVGTGSGYLTALLARCAAHVYSRSDCVENIRRANPAPPRKVVRKRNLTRGREQF